MDFITIVLGYGVLFAYFLFALNKREMRYLREETEQRTTRLEERFQSDLKSLRDENRELRSELRGFKNK